MKKELYSIVTSSNEGYNTIYRFGSWRIAMTNDAPHIRRENLKTFGKHLDFDEAFVLLEGSAYLLLGDGDDEIGNVIRVDLEKDKVCVVKAGTWHVNVSTSPETKLLIMENDDTSHTVNIPVPDCLRSE